MANRRMFSKDVICTDKFLLMNPLSQCLYFQWAMYADDDGFVSNSKIIQRATGATDENAKELEENGYVIFFNSRVLVVTHWKMLNTLKADRYTKTVYQKEFLQLELNDDKSYKIRNQDVSKVETQTSQDVSKVETQTSQDKESIVKDSLNNDCDGKPSPDVPSLEEIFNFYHLQKLAISPIDFYKRGLKTNWSNNEGQPLENWKGAYIAMCKEWATPSDNYNEDLTLEDVYSQTDTITN